jgi:hypothetical protein
MRAPDPGAALRSCSPHERCSRRTRPLTERPVPMRPGVFDFDHTLYDGDSGGHLVRG